MGGELGTVPTALFQVFALVFGATLHEYAHGQAADWLGDDTARRLGRLTINPLPHLDPFGSVVLPLLCVLLPGNFFFAYAKPVPVNPLNFRHPRWGMLWTSLAGVIANLAVAFGVAIVFRGLLLAAPALAGLPEPVYNFVPLFAALCTITVAINLMLFFFNLIPIPPLDGSRVLTALLPLEQALRFERIAPFGLIILIVLINTGPFQWFYQFFIGGGMWLLLRAGTGS